MAAYIAAWLVAGAVVAVVAVAVVHDRESRRRPAVALPPVAETSLGDAVRRAGCTLARRDPGPAGRGPAVRAGIYARPIPASGRERAIREGVVVVEYRADTAPGDVAILAEVQRALPAGTLLAPSAAPRASQVSATSFTRQLRCRRLTRRSYDALQLFLGRYVGTRPA